MIVKSPTFDQTFSEDIKEITINRKLPLLQKGSYKVKSFGAYISDIDLTARVQYNEKLLEVLSNLLNRIQTRSTKFIFVRMSCGVYRPFQTPWTIDEKGGCNFNLEETKNWYNEFSKKNLVPPVVLEKIRLNLFAPALRLKNLIAIESLLFPYAEIIWRQKDIERTYIDYRGERYHILDVMKTETPVLEYIYIYGNEIVGIDVGMVDRNWKTGPQQTMYRYYTEDWYKILKSYRWKLEEQYKPEYFETMTSVDLLISLKYQLTLYRNAQRYNILPTRLATIVKNDMRIELERFGIQPQGMTLLDLEDMVYEKVNELLKDSVVYYTSYLSPGHLKDNINKLIRGIESQIPTSKDEIKKRTESGIKCPFFAEDIDDFEKISSLAQRINMKTEILLECFENVSKTTGRTIRDIVNEMDRDNGLSITEVPKEGIVALKRNGEIIKVYPQRDIKKLIAYVLLR